MSQYEHSELHFKRLAEATKKDMEANATPSYAEIITDYKKIIDDYRAMCEAQATEIEQLNNTVTRLKSELAMKNLELMDLSIKRKA